jgi:hypothetical protein
MAKDQRPYAVICLWEYTPPKKKNEPYKKLWKLVECYGVDQDGYACTESKHASGDRHSYDQWMSRKCWYDEKTKKLVYTCPADQDAGDYDWDSIMGRAVTVWSVESGVRLARLNPPEWVPWLGSSFTEELAKLKHWFSFLEDGHTLYLGTARAAEKMLWPKEQPQSGV